MKRILHRIGRLLAKLLRWAIAHPDVVLDLVAPDKRLASVALDAVRMAKGIDVDGTGVDLKYYGDTASSYMQWDMSDDAVRIAKGIDVDGTAVEPRARREYAADMIVRHAERNGIEISRSQAYLLVEAAYQAVKAVQAGKG